MKQVLVIDGKQYFDTFPVDYIRRQAIEHFIKYHSPSNLLAEFKGYAYDEDFKRTKDNTMDFFHAYRTVPVSHHKHQSVYVLILGEK